MAERRAALLTAVERIRAAQDRVDAEGAPATGPALDAETAEELELLLAERDEQRRRHEVVVEVPRHLSASAVVQLATDSERFALALRRPMPAAPALAARRGTAFHAWVEQHYARAAIVDILDLPGSADETAPDDVSGADLARMKALFLASEWAERIPEAIEIAVETVLDGFAIRGRIDAVFPRETAASPSSTGRRVRRPAGPTPVTGRCSSRPTPWPTPACAACRPRRWTAPSTTRRPARRSGRASPASGPCVPCSTPCPSRCPRRRLPHPVRRTTREPARPPARYAVRPRRERRLGSDDGGAAHPRRPRRAGHDGTPRRPRARAQRDGVRRRVEPAARPRPAAARGGARRSMPGPSTSRRCGPTRSSPAPRPSAPRPTVWWGSCRAGRLRAHRRSCCRAMSTSCPSAT